jgi:Helix-turn-helix domain
MRRKNTVEKIGEHTVSLGGVGRALSNGGPPLDPLEPLFTVNEAAAILRCSRHSLNKWRLTGGGPKFIYVGRRVRYRRADLIQFIDLSTRNSTSDPGNASEITELEARSTASTANSASRPGGRAVATAA